GAVASLSGGSGALTLDITNGGTDIWHVQLRRAGIHLQQGRTYRVTLTGSSAEGLTASTTVAENNIGEFNPYSGISMLRFPPEGITHTFFFRMNNASDSNARINLDIGLAAGTLVLS
ncbi:carbohydrate binding domain-containing protein, partial [Arthrospira platensis SPKY1]|nr:carbohydrate binding domain-containing protein [Arthrospira platensis SPKY1]